MRAFTHCINARNVNEAMEHSLRYLPFAAREEESRVGKVLVSDQPVITCYSHPTERVLFSPMRDANPFFHLMESLWMLGGRDDVAFPVIFNSTFGQFSDDGERFWGAYGYRWRRWFGYDQLNLIIEELQRDPSSRRCVLAMWSPGEIVYPDGPNTLGIVQPDLMQALAGGKDVPCNTNIFFRITEGKDGPQLDFMVNARSNDLFWGAYGANVVHMSMLHEYVALSVGVQVGRLWQNSFNFHAYVDRFPIDKFKAYADDARAHDFYAQGLATPYKLMEVSQQQWDKDLVAFLEWAETDLSAAPYGGIEDPFFTRVAIPARLAWAAHKRHDYPAAMGHCGEVIAADWRKAMLMWIERRWQRFARKEQENVG